MKRILFAVVPFALGFSLWGSTPPSASAAAPSLAGSAAHHAGITASPALDAATVEAVGQAQGGQTDPEKITVYVTRTGQKYHRDGCRYLARSKIPMSLKDAAKRFEPCKVCRPPTLSK